ncbi:MAG: hypothetical protein A2428_07910 [Bdellovibrionales bacterium RIFOXYC1_FULL_54_43]|nr:MAG: hypothetical protein A2428_07910 [Bdellovibrionales bacterium RIFOXYC1_FULL_54_43]OFZ84848.1 MAG: hypothetical protein A2603_03005 [Bdellovibrionales bacterium RIFOXYD1_FULL_55_31]
MYDRILDLNAALKRKSAFLLGPRATGKSWLIHRQLKAAQVFDLLNIEIFDRLLKRPHSLAEEIQSDTVVIDEVQKLPRLLDEVHRLIEERSGIRFLLTGSSARKLKHGGANLLAGRASQLPMFPLTRAEIPDFDLIRYCNTGGLPRVWQSEESWAELRDYVQLYLKEEIIAEAVVRRIDHYARFLDVIGRCSGEELNYQKVSNDAGVPPRTVANFVEVLKDTLVAFELEPYAQVRKRKIVSKSKIYMFDVGVANYLAGRKELLARSDSFGKAFEHFVIQEIRAYLGYNGIDFPLTYWRPRVGKYEVDCIIGDEVAVEIKSFENFSEQALASLRALKAEAKLRSYYLVSRDPIRRKVNGVEVVPVSEFLNLLWRGQIV